MWCVCLSVFFVASFYLASLIWCDRIGFMWSEKEQSKASVNEKGASVHGRQFDFCHTHKHTLIIQTTATTKKMISIVVRNTKNKTGYKLKKQQQTHRTKTEKLKFYSINILTNTYFKRENVCVSLCVCVCFAVPLWCSDFNRLRTHHAFTNWWKLFCSVFYFCQPTDL